MARAGDDTRPMTTAMATSTASSITVRGLDLATEVIGVVSFGDMVFLELEGRLPTAQESRLLNAMLVTLVEHGMTPSTLAARLTYLGAPESIQAAIAAGLSGVGSVFLGALEGAARMLAEGVAEGGPVDEQAARIVERHRVERRHVPGIGHPIHTEEDPRTPALFRVAAETGFAGPHIELINAVARTAGEVFDRHLPVNANGACAAVVCELGLDWRIARGLIVLARCAGILGHLNEEIRNPIARTLWEQADASVTYTP